jgi:hypothetical protein
MRTNDPTHGIIGAKSVLLCQSRSFLYHLVRERYVDQVSVDRAFPFAVVVG